MCSANIYAYICMYMLNTYTLNDSAPHFINPKLMGIKEI